MKEIWRALAPELKPHWRRLVVVFLLGAAVSALKAVTPDLMGRLPGVWSSKDQELAIQIPLILTGVWVLQAAARYFHMFGMRYISDVIAVGLRKKLMNKYLSLNLSFHQSFLRGSGGLISRMLNDIHFIQSGLHNIGDMVREPFMIIFAFGYLVYLDWRLTMIILLAAPIVTAILSRFARSVRKYSRQNQESMEDLTQVLKESLDGTRIVQSFNLEDEMRRRFDQTAENFLRSDRKIISREEASGPVSESIASVFIAILLIYIGNRAISGHFDAGNFFAFTFAIILLQDSVKKLQNGYVRLQSASVAVNRLHAILDSTSVVPEIAQSREFPKDWTTIEFRNVSFAFAQTKVLKKVSLTIRRGEMVALVGASGSGKSTLVNLLPRFFDPTEGEIEIGGIPIQEMNLRDLRSHIALVAQDVFLFSDSVAKNIHSGNFSKPAAGIEEAARLANAHNFIVSSDEGYDSRVGDRGSRFSGGEKQRISIARAIFKDAPILILDEATSALDSESELQVQQGLDHLLSGRTALVVAHRLSTIAKADRIIVMREGEIVEQGTHQELLAKRGEYHRFFELQAGI